MLRPESNLHAGLRFDLPQRADENVTSEKSCNGLRIMALRASQPAGSGTSIAANAQYEQEMEDCRRARRGIRARFCRSAGAALPGGRADRAVVDSGPVVRGRNLAA